MSQWARTATGDKVLPLLGQGASAIITDPNQSAAIRINDGLQFWLGNWQLDQSQGTPWQTYVGQKPQLVALANMVRKAILLLGAPVVTKVTQVLLTFKRTQRDLGYQFAAETNDGATIVGGSNGPDGLPYAGVK